MSSQHLCTQTCGNGQWTQMITRPEQNQAFTLDAPQAGRRGFDPRLPLFDVKLYGRFTYPVSTRFPITFQTGRRQYAPVSLLESGPQIPTFSISLQNLGGWRRLLTHTGRCT